MTSDAILSRLVEVTKLIEWHRAAMFVLDQERLTLQNELRASGPKPPEMAT